MKRFLSVIMMLVILLSCCACANKDAAVNAPVAEDLVKDELKMSPEELYGHIDQTQSVDGVYKIWSIVGIEQIAKHPEAKFEVLFHIDLEGATLAPIPEFTGEIDGANWTVKNFTVAGDGENFGFFAINKGNVHNLTIEDVTFQPGSNAKNIGAWAGTNEGTLLRCYANNSTLNVSAAAENASYGAYAGVNTGSLTNIGGAVFTEYTAPGAAKIGGLVGTAKGGTNAFMINDGKLTVTGANKTVGLFAGDATETVFQTCIWRGEDNSLDGILFNNFTGNADDDELVVADDALWRDNGYIEPLPDNIMALRNKVVAASREITSVSWHLNEDLVHACYCGAGAGSCTGIYSEVFQYYGQPYNHQSSSAARFRYTINEDGSIADWMYDLPQVDGVASYIGTDCSSAVQQAWWTVSNTTNTMWTEYMLPAHGCGSIPVGDWTWDFVLTRKAKNGVNALYTKEYLDATDYQVMMESYAAMRPGDAVVNQVEAGGHVQLVSSFPVIVKDQNDDINAEYSYAHFHEQGGTSNQKDDANNIASSCSVDDRYTFAYLYGTCYVPITTIELQTGKQDPVEATLEGAVDGYAGMFSGIVRTNYHLDYVTLTILDSEGNEVLDHPMFATVQKRNDYGDNSFTARNYTDWYDISEFTKILSQTKLEKGESYTYTVTANLATFDNIVVHEGSFTYGAA